MPFAPSEPFSPRPIRPLGVREHDGWRLTLYSITYGPAPLDRPLYEQGLTLALAALPLPAVAASRPGLGFVIFHQGRGVHYLVLNWWDNENEFFNRVFVRPFRDPQAEHGAGPAGWDSARADKPLVAHPARAPVAGLWRPAGGAESACVWDLEVIWHERNAYVRHVLSRPGGPDARGYLADAFSAG